MDSEAPDASGRQDGTLALYSGTVAAYADMYLTQPILPLLSREFGVGPARAGFTVSAVVLAIAAASSFYGPLSDVLGRKRVMVGATLLRSVATLACAFTLTFYYLGGTFGSVLPGLAWQAWGWTGVVACCSASVAVGLLANALLCGVQRP